MLDLNPNRQKDSLDGLKGYLIGFALSLFLTMIAYLTRAEELISTKWLPVGILSLAFVQAIVQLVFFLHLGKEAKPRWNLYSLTFMLMVLVILVVGSIWVMDNLDYRMMPKM